jgi:hypothetical protein
VGTPKHYDWHWQAVSSTRFMRQPRLAIGAVLPLRRCLVEPADPTLRLRSGAGSFAKNTRTIRRLPTVPNRTVLHNAE